MNRNAHEEKKEADRLRRIRELTRLRTDRIYLGIVIGDRAVAMGLAHVDPLRHLLMMRQRVAPMTLGRGCQPSIPQMRDGLLECWDGLGGERLEYSECLLCLPPWATARLEVTESISIRPAWGRSDRAYPRVSDADVLRAQQALWRKNTPPARVATRVLPRAYVLEGGRRVADPRGEITRGLDLHGQLELADAGIARTLLDALASMGLRVDLMASPQGAVDALLRGEEDAADSAVVEIGPRSTGFSFRQDGAALHVEHLPRGADEVLANTAARLRTDLRGLEACLEARRDWLLDAKACAAKTLPLWPEPNDSAFSVRRVHEALLREAGAHFALVSERLEAARRERGLRTDRLFLAGDEPVVVDAVARVASALHPGRCQVLRSPWQAGGPDQAGTPGRTRMAGLLLLGALGAPVLQPFLASYNGDPKDPAYRVFAEDSQWALRRLASGWRRFVVPSARRTALRIMQLFM